MVFQQFIVRNVFEDGQLEDSCEWELDEDQQEDAAESRAELETQAEEQANREGEVNAVWRSIRAEQKLDEEDFEDAADTETFGYEADIISW